MSQPSNPYSVDACPVCGVLPNAGTVGGICTKCMLVAGLASERRADLNATASFGAGPTSRFDPPSPRELENDFPELEVIELAGIGGMGVVYKARQRDLDRVVALKILPQEIASEPSFSIRFAREARALAKLNHKNIVQIYQTGKNDKYFFFLMEFVDGINLRQAIQKGDLEPHEALSIVPQICDALQYAHSAGIVHRDIKPENILLDKTGLVKVADFGLAKLIDTDHSLTATQQIMGTVHYMAPEQVRETSKVDHRADIYSLGVVFYEMLTGNLPLGKFAVPSRTVKVDPRLDSVVLRTLENEPDNRYQTANEIRTDIATVDPHEYRSDVLSPEKTQDEVNLRNRAQSMLLIPGIIMLLLGVYRLFWSIQVFVQPSPFSMGWKSSMDVVIAAWGVIFCATSVAVLVAGWQMIRVRWIPYLRIISAFLVLPVLVDYFFWMRLWGVLGLRNIAPGEDPSMSSIDFFDIVPILGAVVGIVAGIVLFFRTVRDLQRIRKLNERVMLKDSLSTLTAREEKDVRNKLSTPSTLMMLVGGLGVTCSVLWLSLVIYGVMAESYETNVALETYRNLTETSGLVPLFTMLAAFNLPVSLLMMAAGVLLRRAEKHRLILIVASVVLLPLNPVLYPLYLLTGLWTLFAIYPLTSKLVFLKAEVSASQP